MDKSKIKSFLQTLLIGFAICVSIIFMIVIVVYGPKNYPTVAGIVCILLLSFWFGSLYQKSK